MRIVPSVAEKTTILPLARNSFEELKYAIPKQLALSSNSTGHALIGYTPFWEKFRLKTQHSGRYRRCPSYSNPFDLYSIYRKVPNPLSPKGLPDLTALLLTDYVHYGFPHRRVNLVPAFLNETATNDFIKHL